MWTFGLFNENIETINKNKTRKVKNHLLNKGSITGLDAFELYKSMSLPKIIQRLKRKGWNIDTKYVGKTRYAVYTLVVK